MNQEKEQADTKEKNEEWQFEYEQDRPLNKSKRNVIDPQKPLCPQNLNGALREYVQPIRITKADYAVQRRICQRWKTNLAREKDSLNLN